jgi:hypothetical protein
MINQEKAKLWRSRLDAFEQSGMNVNQFCRQNSLEPRAYRYWRDRLAEVGLPFVSNKDSSAGPKTQSPSWLCVQPAVPVSPDPRPSLVVKISGAEIEVHSGFDASLLRAVVTALGEQPC